MRYAFPSGGALACLWLTVAQRRCSRGRAKSSSWRQAFGGREPQIEQSDGFSIFDQQFEKQKQEFWKRVNSDIKTRWRKTRKKGVAPTVGVMEAPDNPWSDRYILCRDCHRRMRQGLEPKKGCVGTTLVELDMPAPFSRDNVMVLSCELAQCIQKDLWVQQAHDGSWQRAASKEDPGAIPVQICATCHKTSLEEGRRFRTCPTCQGVAYCSDECYNKHRFTHLKSCHPPYLPYREQWGPRGALFKMQREVYPLIKMNLIRAPEQHQFAWRKPKELPPGVSRKTVQWPPQLPAGQERVPALPTPATQGEAREELASSPANDFAALEAAVAAEVAKRKVNIDPNHLMSINMTEEEYLAMEARLARADFKRQMQLRTEEALTAKRESEKTKTTALKKAGATTLEKVLKRAKPNDIVLDDPAIIRVETAALRAPTKRPERAPWEIDDEEEEEVIDTDAVEFAPYRKGVVYESDIARRMKNNKMKLSKEQLARLEKVARKKREANEDDPKPTRSFQETIIPDHRF